MTVSSQLTADLRKLVLRLEDDLRERLAQDDENLSRWRAEHQGALDAQRTSSAWQAWRDDKITQAAVAWILTTVFVRFAEDNALVRPVWISGPGARRQEALDAQIVFFRAHPELTDREWLLEPVEYLKKLPATADLVREHSALWQVQPSGRMATEILEFWRQTDAAGLPSFDLADTELSTRFLGDLYQDLSDYAKKTFALLQTPEFVEEFILDQTLTPALAERPLEGFKLIDPTCGSGHFLLGAFARLTDAWGAEAPGMDVRARVQKALDAVHGVDLNPFAVAIARFRLTVAALSACSETSLELAPAFSFHIAAGDSLLHGHVQQEFRFEGFDADAKLSGFAYSTEDSDQLKRILAPGQYDVVVGNPPYITVKDRTLNRHYRNIYSTCKGTYALTVPFMERFFGLARRGTESQRAGWVGQITSNSFMKRGFGTKLIEEFLPTLDLCTLIDSEGAWIPGHNTDGTPTTIIVGRNQSPVRSTVRAALSKGKRETRTMAESGERPYWDGISQFIDAPDGYEDEWISISDVPRNALASHPWVLGGDGVTETIGIIAKNPLKLHQLIDGEIGRAVRIGADEPYLRDRPGHGPESVCAVPFLTGGAVRDYAANAREFVLYPYKHDDAGLSALPEYLWRYRTTLRERSTFSGNMEDAKRKWWEFMQHTASAYETPLSIAFSNVASHNHFGLNRGGTVFSSHAPVIKLPADATEDDHLALLGVLGSSLTCLWMRQLSQPKGGAAERAWSRTYEYTGGTVQALPLPNVRPIHLARIMSSLAARLESTSSVLSGQALTAESLKQAQAATTSLRSQMIAVQEEMDWDYYRLYGLVTERLTYCEDLPDVRLGERAFEIALARGLAEGNADGSWFDRHGSTPITEIPSRWPEDYRRVVQRRLELIESNSSIRLLERPEYKRRWASEPWEKQQERALRSWLLDRLDERSLWFDRQGRPAARSIGQLADMISRDNDFLSVLSLWDGSRDVNVVKALTGLLIDEAIPYLAAHRLKESGLRKYEAWEQAWDLQRREDSDEFVGNIAVPPVYSSADFRKASWWQARGKLDVPKERFILYPDAARSTDQTLLLGWAGWNHVEQFLALAAVMDQLVADGAPDEQLIPLVAGLGEILPWVKQWHADIDPAYGVSMADFCAQQFEERAAQIDRSHGQLKAWRPSMAVRGRKAKVTA